MPKAPIQAWGKPTVPHHFRPHAHQLRSLAVVVPPFSTLVDLATALSSPSALRGGTRVAVRLPMRRLVRAATSHDRPCMEGMNLKGRLPPVAVACLAASHGDEDNSGSLPTRQTRSGVMSTMGGFSVATAMRQKGMYVADGRLRLVVFVR